MATVGRWKESSVQKISKLDNKAEEMKSENIKRDKWYKILYGIGCVAYFSGCLYQSSSFLAIYYKYPTAIEVNVFQEAVVTFPALTVCNGNR